MSTRWCTVAAVRALADPVADWPWIAPPDVWPARAQLLTMRGCPVPVLDAVWNTRAHIERVAWLAQHGWTDPIYLDVGCPALATPTWWPVQDGNHRLAAAILTGQTAILVAVSGDLTVIDSRLPALALDS